MLPIVIYSMPMMAKELNVGPTIVKNVRIHLDAFGVGHEESAINTWTRQAEAFELSCRKTEMNVIFWFFLSM